MNEQTWLDVLQQELVVALGCTEPVAIAYASAKARHYTTGELTHIRVVASKNVIKNAMAVGIPGMETTGIDFVAALGAMSGAHEQELQVLVDVTAADEARAKTFVADGHVTLEVSEAPDMLYIEVEVRTASDTATVVICGTHTNITRVIHNGSVIVQRSTEKVNSSEKDCEKLS
ncbi:MAG: serine dehydratase subunit alpha family protein, partial [Bacilli bacterium]